MKKTASLRVGNTISFLILEGWDWNRGGRETSGH